MANLNVSSLFHLLWHANMSDLHNLTLDNGEIDNNTLELIDSMYNGIRGHGEVPPVPGDVDISDFDYHGFQADLDMVKEPWVEDRAFWPTSLTYGLAFFIGVIGNSLVVFALLADKKARNVTASFLVSLAIADLLFLLLCVPYEYASKFTGYWSGGRALCKISGFIEMLSASASILNLSAVSVER